MVTINEQHHRTMQKYSQKSGIDEKTLFQLYIKNANQYFASDKRPAYHKVGAIVWNEYYSKAIKSVVKYCNQIIKSNHNIEDKLK